MSRNKQRAWYEDDGTDSGVDSCVSCRDDDGNDGCSLREISSEYLGLKLCFWVMRSFYIERLRCTSYLSFQPETRILFLGEEGRL